MKKSSEKTKKRETKRNPNINVRSTAEMIDKFKFVCDAYSISQREFIERSIDSAYSMVRD